MFTGSGLKDLKYLQKKVFNFIYLQNKTENEETPSSIYRRVSTGLLAFFLNRSYGLTCNVGVSNLEIT